MATFTKVQIEALAAAAYADDLALDLDAMCLWEKDDVKKFFETGGEHKPSPPAVDLSDAPSGDDAVLAAKKRGTSMLNTADFVGAAAAYRQAIALCATPALLAEHGAALNSNLALVTLKQGDADASLAAATESVRLKPEWHKAHFRQGESLFELKRHDEALASYRAAQKLSPGDADVQRMVKIAEQAAKGGVYILQLSPGRDIAISPSSQQEQLVFSAAAQMRNFIYLICDASSRVCYAVDACWDPKGIAEYAQAQRLKLVGAIASHYHYDHVGGLVPQQLAAMICGPFGVPKDGAVLPGLAEMKTNHGCTPYVHRAEVARVAKQIKLAEADFVALEQGSTLPLGAAGQITVYHTPGHSGGSVCLSVEPAGKRPIALVVGDTIFPGSCGRLDLPDSDVNKMFDSLQSLRTFADDVKVYPGHGYSGDSSTIGQEKANGLLRPFDRATWNRMHG